MKSWAYQRAIAALLDVAREATQAAFAIVGEEDHELANQIDQARYEVAKACGILEVDQRAKLARGLLDGAELDRLFAPRGRQVVVRPRARLKPHWSSVKVPTEKEAEAAGYDAGKNGANTTNCHFRFFGTRELTSAWECGNKRALQQAGDPARSPCAGDSEDQR